VSYPVPGARHDAAAIHLTGWADTLAEANWIADSAYRAAGAITPVTRMPGQEELRESDAQYNKQVSSFPVRRRTVHSPPEKLADPLARLPPPTEETPIHHRARRQTRTIPDRLVNREHGF
jgi:hypothetical protein